MTKIGEATPEIPMWVTGILIHCWLECSGMITLENSLVFAYKTKYNLTLQSGNRIPRHLPN